MPGRGKRLESEAAIYFGPRKKERIQRMGKESAISKESDAEQIELGRKRRQQRMRRKGEERKKK